jgi:hypothetical protein
MLCEDTVPHANVEFVGTQQIVVAYDGTIELLDRKGEKLCSYTQCGKTASWIFRNT